MIRQAIFRKDEKMKVDPYFENDLCVFQNAQTNEELFNQYQKENKQIRNQMIINNIPLVMFTIHKRFFHTFVEEQDLLQIGIIGLIKAIDTYNPNKNIQFSTYAITCIDNEILMYIRKDKRHYHQLSFEEQKKKEEELSFFNFFSCQEEPLESTILKERKKEVRTILNDLTSFERDLIISYFGLNGKSYTQEELAIKYQISRSYISKIIKNILQKMKKILIDKYNYFDNRKNIIHK